MTNVNSQKGFTIIEALIAVFVLIIAVVTPLSIASKSLQSSRIAKDQIVATYLAQEGIDYMRAIRDSYALNDYLNGRPAGFDWMNEFGKCKNADCNIDATIIPSPSNMSGICDISTIDCFALKNINGIYKWSIDPSVGASNFARTVKVEKVDTRDFEALVSSTVTWTTGNYNGKIVLTEHLFDQYQF